MPDKLLICAAWDGAEEMVLRKEARTAPSAGEIRRSLVDGCAVFRSDTESPIFLSLGAKDATWSEAGIVDVTGPQVGPGLQWYLPGADAAIYYPTTTGQVEGTALGRPVKGFLFYEEAYVPSGGRLYVHHDPLLGDNLHTTWYYVLDGEEWEMIPAPQGHMTGLGRVPNPQQEGLIQRKGVTRKPVVRMAWDESVPPHGDERIIRRQLLGHP